MKILLLFVATIPLVWTYSSGPPSSVCSSMTPSPSAHGQAQESDVPYELLVGSETVKSGDSVHLSLTKINPSIPDFKGFMIEAIDNADNSISGSFQPDSFVKVMSCGPSKAGAVSHNGGSAKRFANVTWIAPNVDVTKNIKFFFTVVQEKETFWVKREAQVDVVVEPSTNADVEPEAEPESGAVDSSVPNASPLHQSYQGCATTKGCFGSEDGCIQKRDCQVLFSYKYSPATKSFLMELLGSGVSAGTYIAAGISTDATMGSDLVFFCSSGGDGVKVSWNQGKSNRLGVTGVTVNGVNVKAENDILTCSFSVDENLNPVPPAQSSAQSFNLGAEKYHVLLATGNLAGNGELSYHSERTPSVEAIDLKSSSLAAGAQQSWLIQVHGCLMVFAWLASAASGMTMARYYKQTWTSIKPLGKDFWFRFHQIFMALAVLLSLTAFFVILAELKVEPFDSQSIKVNPHAVIGIVCIILAFLNPIMAYFRPHPGTKNRWLFNWAHWFVGNSAFLFGVVAIFLSVELPSPNLPQTMTDAMIAYVVIHFVAHMVLMAQRFHASHRDAEVKDEAMPGNDGDAYGAGIRKVVFFVYLTFVWVFAIAFVVIIFQSKKI